MEKLRLKASFRREERCFPVEGIRMIREVPPAQRRELFLTGKALQEHPELSTWCSNVETVADHVMEKLADTRSPQGMVAVVSMPVSGSLDAKDRDDPLIFLLDGVQDPGNVGTIIRTAEAVGAAEVILSRDSADPYSPKVVRSTMGAIFRVPLRIEDDLPSLLWEMKQRKIRICGMHLSGTDFYRMDLTGPLTVLIGSEGNGLSPEVAAEADTLLRIPMDGQVESLNAAVSAAVVGYEAYRQRHMG